MHTLGQCLCRHQHATCQHGGIVADAMHRGDRLGVEAVGQTFNEGNLAHLSYLCPTFLVL